MKIIKQPPLTEWKYQHTCATCDAVLEVESTDVHHETIRGDRPADSDYDKFYASCAVCKNQFTIPEGKLNKAVKFQAKNRAKPNSNYFDR